MANTFAKKGVVPPFDKDRFDVGLVGMKAGVWERFGQQFLDYVVQRHSCGDWGLADELTCVRNEDALDRWVPGLCVKSIHDHPDRGRVVVVSLFDRFTTIIDALRDD